MTDITGSFTAEFTLTPEVISFATKGGSFDAVFSIEAGTSANRNSLTLTVNTSSSLTLFDPFPGSFKFPGSTSYVGEPSPVIGTLALS